MSNLYPPILEAQRESIPSMPLSGDFFSIPFTMPLSVVTAEIGHVQVLIRRQINLDSWSTQGRPAAVPEKEAIYLPGFKTSAAEHGANCLRQANADLWYVDIPVSLIRGITSTNGGDTGNPGFPAGGINKEGENFTIQIRFGDSPLSFATAATFADWKRLQIVNSFFGEWSNSQRMFVYALPQDALTIESMFSVTVHNDPIARLSWSYNPVSIDPLMQVRISYSWTTPDNYGNSFRSKNLPIESHDGRGASAAGEAILNVMRFAAMTVTLQFITVNNTSYTWVASSTNMLMPRYPFALDELDTGVIYNTPPSGEEIEDGVVELLFSWNWTEQTLAGCFKFYRVDLATFDTIELKTVFPLAEAQVGGAVTTTIKDYSVEMGAEYLYIANSYDANGNYLTTLGWDPENGLYIEHWNPTRYLGYVRQMNFQGNIFLTTKLQQLRLQGNVSLSNFRRNVSEQFTQTIGGAYPFYSRAAEFNYRTASIQGLVSLATDTTNTFLRFKSQVLTSEMQEHLAAAAERYQDRVLSFPRNSDYNARLLNLQLQYYAEIAEIYMGYNPLTGEIFLTDGAPPWTSGQLWYRQEFDVESIVLRAIELFGGSQISMNLKRIQDPNNPNNNKLVRVKEDKDYIRGPMTLYSERKALDMTDVRYSDRTSDIIYAERKFRDAVMHWLSDGRPKLFRSETEGNMIVIVSGVTFSPLNAQRRVYSLSATITEIAEYNLENLVKYDLVPAEFESFYIPNIDYGFIPGTLDDGFLNNAHEDLRRFIHYQMQIWTHNSLAKEDLT